METLLVILTGIGLSAACGFRVFVPLLGVSVAALSGHLHLNGGFAWIGTWPALITFGVATVCEILAYSVPWLDNVMDLISLPAAAVAGTILTAAMISDMSPYLRWSLAMVAGGGAAASIQLGTAALRGLSTASTGGFGNFALSLLELFSASTVTVLALLFGVAGLVLLVIIVVAVIRKLLQLKNRTPQAS